MTYTEPGFYLANTLGGKHPLKNSVEKKDHPEIILLPPLRGGISTNVSSNHHLMVLNPPGFSEYYVNTPLRSVPRSFPV